MPHPKPAAKARLHAALQSLRDNNSRITEPRRAILDILTREHGPFTVEEIHQRMTGGDLVTVYRSLAAMDELNLVRRCDFGDGAYRYEFNTGEHHHHHIICRTCRSVETLDFCVAESLERFARQLGYANVTHTLEVFGICVRCQHAEPAKAATASRPKIGARRKPVKPR